MREQGGELRMDVVMYILYALQLFEKAGKQKTGTITFEIAMLGRGGLDINDPAQKYVLKSLPGKFSGLQPTCPNVHRTKAAGSRPRR